MGGTMAVESEVGVGTSVHFCAIFGILADGLQQDSAEEQPLPKETTGRILLAEDDEVTQFAVRKLLEKVGYTVVPACNGKEALDLLYAEDFDVLVMDVQMPVMSGIEATRLIRTSTDLGPKQNIPIVALTAYAMPDDRKFLLQSGMNDYLAKPVSLSRLVEVLQKNIMT